MSRLRVVTPEAPPPKDPHEGIGDDAPSPGGYIREQRVRRGLSVEQLAVATKIPASSLRRLEDDEFHALPGPVFVKGFLRCCTRALGLPSETVMELLYERERAALHARRQRPSFSGSESEVGVMPTPRTPPRIKERPAPNGGVMRRALVGLPGANAVVWLIVAALVAIMVMAAFNLAGGGPVGGPNT